MVRKLAAGNWKMHGLSSDLAQIDVLLAMPRTGACDVALALPATLIAPGAGLGGDDLRIGGQDCHAQAQGAHTGDISAAMLADAGASFVILGHSERRADHFETDALVAAKVTMAQRAGLQVILCLGESLEQYQAGETLQVLRKQLAASVPDGVDLAQLVVAYEPIWAIGTGLTPTAAEVAEVHAALRSALQARFGAEGAQIALLYGGSVKPSNAAEIFAVPNVDGALVGGASLKAADFDAIIRALEAA